MWRGKQRPELPQGGRGGLGWIYLKGSKRESLSF